MNIGIKRIDKHFFMVHRAFILLDLEPNVNEEIRYKKCLKERGVYF